MKLLFDLLFKNKNEEKRIEDEDKFILCHSDELINYINKLLNNKMLSLINGFRNKSKQDRIKLYSNYQDKLIEDINDLQIPRLIVAPLEHRFIKHKCGEAVTIGFETNIIITDEPDDLGSILFFFQVTEDNTMNFFQML